MLSPGDAIIWVLRLDVQVAHSHGWWLQAQLVLPIRVLQLSKLWPLHATWVLMAWQLGSKKKSSQACRSRSYRSLLIPPWTIHSITTTTFHWAEIHEEKGNRLRLLTEGIAEIDSLPIFLNWNTFDIDFPGGIVVKNPPANTGDMSLIPGLGRFHLLQSNCTPVPQLLKPTHPRASAPKRRVAPTHCS